MVVRMVVVPLCGTQPCIPIHVLRQLLSGREAVYVGIPLVPAAFVVHVCGYGMYILDDARFHPRLELEVVGFGMSLVTHLSHHVRTLACGFHQQLGFVEGACHRLFHVYVLARCQCQHGDREVRVVGRSDGYGVEVLSGLVEQLAEVAELLCLRVHADYLLCMRCTHVYVAQGHYVYHLGFGKVFDDLHASVTDTDISNLYFFALRFLVGHVCCSIQDAVATQCDACRGYRHGADKISSCSHDFYRFKVVVSCS